MGQYYGDFTRTMSVIPHNTIVNKSLSDRYYTIIHVLGEEVKAYRG